MTFLENELEQIFLKAGILEWATKLEFYEFDKTNNESFYPYLKLFEDQILDSGNTIFYLILDYKLNTV